MPRNVEIKAKVADYEDLIKRAKLLAGVDGIIIEQEDIFFNAPNGRLKLRSIRGEQSVLIHYNRHDQDGPKLSNFHITPVNDVETMKIVLTNALGVKGIVKKSRLLIMHNETRIHIDDVYGLGHFMELEVMLRDDQSVEDGQTIAEDIMTKLNICNSDLLDCAYMDLILKSK